MGGDGGNCRTCGRARYIAARAWAGSPRRRRRAWARAEAPPPSQRSLRPDFAAAVNGWRVRFRVGWRWRVQKYFSFADRKMLTRIDFHG